MLGLGKKLIKLVTHDGSFHADDIFACATLIMVLEKKGQAYEVIRTRDEKIIEKADYVFDVGGVYDEANNRFDHHQIGGAGKRTGGGGIEYASFGLVWKKFGLEISQYQKVTDLLEKKLVEPVDAWDNGFDLVENKFKDVSPYSIQHIFSSLEPTWREENKDIDKIFIKCVSLAKEILTREVTQMKDTILAEEAVVKAYQHASDKKIIILDKHYPSQYILNTFPEPLFTVYPRATNNYWGVKAVRDDPKTFKNRKDLPASWAGLQNEELAKISGVSDAVFCHKGLFMAVAKSKEGAVKLAQIALLEPSN